jgi:hypothetical protein
MTFHPSAQGCACTGASGGRLHKKVLQFRSVIRGQIHDHRSNDVMAPPDRGKHNTSRRLTIKNLTRDT